MNDEEFRKGCRELVKNGALERLNKKIEEDLRDIPIEILQEIDEDIQRQIKRKRNGN